MKNKIGWQKYEDVLENQLASPLVRLMLEQAMRGVEEIEETEIYTDSLTNEPDEDTIVPIITMSADLAQDAALAASFDCWFGHTNFDITPTTLATLEEVEGVEILKIISRYRFFIGIGRMFAFTNVRKELENQILK